MKKLLTLIAASVGLGISCHARQLVWDEARPEWVKAYNVYCSDEIAPVASWELFATTSTIGVDVPFDSARKYFCVTAVGFDDVEVPQIISRSPQSPQRQTIKLLTPRMKT